ncbi:MAG: hypothetical protein ACD_13C00142G0007 [uncultured bacterium]|uniref:mevalonate kinase n=1 Tax=Candidatus Woesebacteria bacterium GW2011_GWA1_40_43 TaxID=1618553 RepID=A0A0G0SQN1_9BACT|nr:MAG: hypothetical protein ACD_13C00142G0007 [uncultured bacterium]KKR54205.1 MAG: Mevalonate kinase [Candidatus Woesebacteria bacterium GW2011_GWD2_40_19]KKR58535.1 MAG: Mevalonate kinase [Candidatus Woesebacteria bacterium GW2011_GWC2_40_30]KKR64716.1 MAG: Mevalonate kinase [Candidatus Woesebacteria bacterium GW2011_GWA1_40_43]HAU65670.1 hypothetical protein [Candidatus Woesebacteria bacterium]
MRAKLKFSAPGKLIISGEHAVVYGYPALVTAIDRRLSIEGSGKDDKITSDIPIGAGMGSSAAFAVATSALRIKKIDLPKINELAYKLEKKHHGSPSGVDNTICTYGGFLWYRKESENLKTFKVIVPKTKFPKIYLLNTGKPVESTKEMVTHVSDLYRGRKSYFDTVFRGIEKITKEFLGLLLNDSNSDFDELVKYNEELLEKLDVVSPTTKNIIRKIEKIGGAAKITGAGGKKESSGMVIVYHNDSDKLLKFAKDNKLDLFSVKIGEEGVRIEK